MSEEDDICTDNSRCVLRMIKERSNHLYDGEVFDRLLYEDAYKISRESLTILLDYLDKVRVVGEDG